MVLVAAVAVPAFLASARRVPPGSSPPPWREGPFDLTIAETGTLQALRSVTYASSIQSNQAKIVALVPEGKLVQKGDLLVLFDAAPFEEEIRKNAGACSRRRRRTSRRRSRT